MCTLNSKVGWAQSTATSQSISFAGFGMSNIWNGEFVNLSDHLADGAAPDYQLMKFPSPRYRSGKVLMRNVNVLSIGETCEIAYRCAGPPAPVPYNTCQTLLDKHALTNIILAKHWNYYFDVGVNKAGVCLPTIPPGVPSNGTAIDHTPTLLAMINQYPNLPISVGVNIAAIKNNAPTQAPATLGDCTSSNNYPIPSVPTNTYASISNTAPVKTETTPTTPNFYALNSGNTTQADITNMPRQENKFMANDYYVHTTDPNISSKAMPAVYNANGTLITPALPSTPCSPTDPCYYGISSGTWGYYKYVPGYMPTKFFSPFAFRKPNANPACPTPNNPAFLGTTFEQDGKTQGYYLKNLATAITRPNPKIDLLWENGEGLYYDNLPMHYWLNDETTPNFPNTYTNNMHTAYKNDGNIAALLNNTTGNCDYIDLNFLSNSNGHTDVKTSMRYPTTFWKLAMKSSQGYVSAIQRYKDGMNVGFGTGANNLVKNFSHYALDHSGNRSYLWEETRNIQTPMRGQRYATPDFYPHQTAWNYAGGGYHAIDWVAESRFVELKHEAAWPAPNAYVTYGKDALSGTTRPPDYLFSPYVAAGWSPEEFLNMRPAQYLALLKVLSVMGAEFFYAGYFPNTPDRYKTIQNTPGYAALIAPANAHNNQYHPSKMIWQAAMPAYAQAVSSYFYDFFVTATGTTNASTLLNSTGVSAILPSSAVVNNRYRLPTTIANTAIAAQAEALAVARQMGNRYVVTVSLQPKNGRYASDFVFNSTNNLFYNPSIAPDAVTPVQITIPNFGSTITLMANRQGRTYLIDRMFNGIIKVRCIDEWHEWKHPIHWNRNIQLQAELPSNNLATTNFYNTLRPANASNENFTIFTTYVTNNQNYAYEFAPTQNGNYAIYVRAASYANANASIVASIDIKDKNGTLIQNLPLNGVNLPACTANFHFEWRKFPVPLPINTADEHTYTLKINAGTGANALTDIDQFFITINDPVPSTEGQPNSECNP